MAGVYDLQTDFYNAIKTALPAYEVWNGEYIADTQANGTAGVSVVLTASEPDGVGAGAFWSSTGLCRVTLAIPYNPGGVDNEAAFVGHGDAVLDALRKITGTQTAGRWQSINAVRLVDGDRGIALGSDQDDPDVRFAQFTFEFTAKEFIA